MNFFSSVLLAAAQMPLVPKVGRYSDYSSMENAGAGRTARQHSTNMETHPPKSVYKSWLIRFFLVTKAKTWNALVLQAPITSTD